MTNPVSRGVKIEVLSIVWMVIEALISIVAGIAACSTLLTAFGIDSVIELISAGTLLWRLIIEARKQPLQRIQKAENVARWIVAFALLLLCFYVLATSVYGLLEHKTPDNSLAGIIISLIAVIGMPLLAKYKKRIADDIGSKALAGDAACSIVCAYMAGAVLLGLVLNYLLHWWWAEHIAALLFLYWLARETKEAFEVAINKETSCSCG